jgi:hypothetical protein
MNAGDTFLIPDSDDHLWMVISEPSLNKECVVVVCFLSWSDHYDQACVLNAGDHPFIKHATCINFPGARIERDDLLEKWKKQGRIRPKEPLSQPLLKRIREAVAASDMPMECYEIMRAQGFAD